MGPPISHTRKDSDMATGPAAELDTVTAVRLGQALYAFLARTSPDADMDEFAWEDAGVSITSGFIEIDEEVAGTVQLLIERQQPPTH